MAFLPTLLRLLLGVMLTDAESQSQIQNQPITYRTGYARTHEALPVRFGEEDVSMIRLPL